jgi:hypothetical protein
MIFSRADFAAFLEPKEVPFGLVYSIIYNKVEISKDNRVDKINYNKETKLIESVDTQKGIFKADNF